MRLENYSEFRNIIEFSNAIMKFRIQYLADIKFYAEWTGGYGLPDTTDSRLCW
jgi:hypothetical protein